MSDTLLVECMGHTKSPHGDWCAGCRNFTTWPCLPARLAAELAYLRERVAAYDALAREARDCQSRLEAQVSVMGSLKHRDDLWHRLVALAPTTPTTDGAA